MNNKDQNCTEGQKLSPNFSLDPINHMKISSTKAISEGELFAKIIKQFEELENKEDLNVEILQTIYEDIKLLPEHSDERLQCEFHYRNLSKKLNNNRSTETANKSGKYVKDSSANLINLLEYEHPLKEIENYFIQMKWPDFINIGSAARKQILNKLLTNREQFHNEKSIIRFVKEETNYLNKLLEQVPMIKDKDLLLNTLNELAMEWFSVQSDQVKGLIAELAVKETAPSHLTLTKLDEWLQKIIKEANHLTTIPIDLLKQQTNEMNNHP